VPAPLSSVVPETYRASAETWYTRVAETSAVSGHGTRIGAMRYITPI
jgi:hypothetical protein